MQHVHGHTGYTLWQESQNHYAVQHDHISKEVDLSTISLVLRTSPSSRLAVQTGPVQGPSQTPCHLPRAMP